jgi:hypothetical protein
LEVRSLRTLLDKNVGEVTPVGTDGIPTAIRHRLSTQQPSTSSFIKIISRMFVLSHETLFFFQQCILDRHRQTNAAAIEVERRNSRVLRAISFNCRTKRLKY